MAVTFPNPVGGIWPLGLIANAVPGTPIAVSINVGAQSQSPTRGRTSRIRQLIIRAKTGNTGVIYVCWKGNNRTNLAQLIDIIPAGQVISLPNGALTDGTNINIDNIVLDADTAADAAICCAVVG